MTLPRLMRGAMLMAVFAAGVACGNDRSAESRSSSDVRVEAPTIRQTDDLGRHLPFETSFPDRWNPGNDGTPYEPCTALGEDDLDVLGVDKASVRDVAGTNGQTNRGCVWEDRRTHDGGWWSVSQFVGNWPSLDADKEVKSSADDHWLPDVDVGDRTIGVLAQASRPRCATYVQSGVAAVRTVVTYIGDDAPLQDAVCGRAIEFTRATIGQMPR